MRTRRATAAALNSVCLPRAGSGDGGGADKIAQLWELGTNVFLQLGCEATRQPTVGEGSARYETPWASALPARAYYAVRLPGLLPAVSVRASLMS